MIQTTQSAAKQHKVSEKMQTLLPVKTEGELKKMSKDELQSVLAYAAQVVADLHKQAPELPTISAAAQILNGLPSELEQLSYDDLYSNLVSLLKLPVYNTALLTQEEVGALEEVSSAEFNNIDFYKLIAGPLNAVVQAQGNAALNTIDFIKAVGFDKEGNIRKVSFTYESQEEAEDGKTVKVKKTIDVPVLSMINIPTLRIQDVDIAFNAKINGVAENRVESTIKVDAELGVKFGPVNFKATASYQRTSTSGTKVEREYTMAVKVKATQDEIPAGLEKILNLLAA